ncbi:MAG: alpha-amylase family protein [Planctomycetota bacterium]
MKTENKMIYGVGAHEPIFHRIRTGHSIAGEWERWERETSDENLDLLEKLGMKTVHIACTKGFGLEYEKPLIERAAHFAERAEKRGMEVSAYVQGFPIYYETFLLEKPEAIHWLAKDQKGDYIPWGGQTFRRWIDPTCVAFHEYQFKIFDYILARFKPTHFGLDNTRVAPFYTDSGRESFRNYLRKKFDAKTAMKEFGLPSFDAVDLPHFDPVYYPPDAMRIVKDPLLQEWAFWRSSVVTDFCRKLRKHIKSIAPKVELHTGVGCDGLRYNILFNNGAEFEDFIDAVDGSHMEESGWRPGVIEPDASSLAIVLDERTAGSVGGSQTDAVRVSTDSRYMKILQNYGYSGHRGFWGEHDRASKLVALAHNFAFGQGANDLGSVGPLASDPRAIDDIKDVLDWGNKHIDVLTGRKDRIAPVAVWRGTMTNAFIRHQPVWESCVIEQMLYEQHIPFTIIFDSILEKALDRFDVLILPGTQCVSNAQIEIITTFVERGGKLLILGEAGTRDERTRVRSRHAFEKLFGDGLPELELIGPPHWVPTLDFNRMPETFRAQYGKGIVAFVKRITPVRPLDLTRDVYMPERQVMAKDIVPPKNEAQIMEMFDTLYPKDALRIDAPRWLLNEVWTTDAGLHICCANLRKKPITTPIRVILGKGVTGSVKVHQLLIDAVETLPVENGCVTLPGLDYFCVIVVPKKK